MEFSDVSDSDSDTYSETEVERRHEITRTSADGALHRAARYGTVELVSFLLRSGWAIDINSAFGGCLSTQYPYETIETPLLAAVTGGDVNIVSFLLNNGAFPEHNLGIARTTALQWTITQGRADMAEILLNHGASINKRLRCNFTEFEHGRAEVTEDKIRAIHLAAYEGQVGILRLLLQRGAPVDDRSEIGFTPLHIASMWEMLQVANFLLEETNAGIDERDEEGRTPLHHACRTGNLKLATILLDKGAGIHTKDNRGCTPLLHFAICEVGRIDLAYELVQRGASVTDTSDTGRSVIHLLCERHYHNINSEIIRFFLEHGADINAKDENGDTALHLSRRIAKDHMLEHIKYLTEAGADVLARNGEGELLIHKVAGRSDMVLKALIDMSPDSDVVNYADRSGTTPLHHAVRCLSSSSVRLLLAHGAGVHPVSFRQGSFLRGTPLHWLVLAQRNDHAQIEIAKILIEHGADVNACDKDGEAPLDCFRYQVDHCDAGPRALVDLLIEQGAALRSSGPMTLKHAIYIGSLLAISRLVESGADVNATDEDGLTAFYNATLYPAKGLFQALLRHGADPSIAVPATPLLPLHVFANGRLPPPRSLMWTLLRGANLPWLEPSCTRSPVLEIWSFEQREILPMLEKIMPTRRKLFLTNVLAETAGSSDLAQETLAQSVAKEIWQNLVWEAENNRYLPQYTLEHTVEDWEASIGRLQESRELLLNQLPEGPFLYFHLIIEIAAAYNVRRRQEEYQKCAAQLYLLEQMAVTDMLEYHKILSSNEIWSLVRQSLADAELRWGVYPGRYFERWRRFMTDILRTRNIETRARRALGRFPPELILRVCEAVSDLEEIPRKSEWKDVWGGEENPECLLDNEVQGDNYFCDIPRADLVDKGSVVFDPISRRFSWVWYHFRGAVYYGFEPTFLYDRSRKLWVVNEKHLNRFGKLYTGDPPEDERFFDQ